MPFPRRQQPNASKPSDLSTDTVLKGFDDSGDTRIIQPRTNRELGIVQPAMRAIKHNALAEARFFLSARAQKFVLFAISLIEPEDVELKKMYTVHASEFAEWAGVGVDSVRRDFNDPPDKQKKISIRAELMNEWIVIPRFYKQERDTHAELFAHWFAGISPEVETGPCAYLDVYFNHLLAPMLQGLRATYYGVHKVVVRKFDSRYAIRLFEWIESWSYQRQRRENRMRVSVDEVRSFLGTDRPSAMTTSRKNLGDPKKIILGNRVYERNLAQYGHFKDKALDVAVREINESTDYLVQVFPVRRASSKAVIAFDFVVHTKSEVGPVTINADAPPVSKSGSTQMRAAPAVQMTLGEQMTLAYPPDQVAPEIEAAPPLASQLSVPDGSETEEEAKLASMVSELVDVYSLTPGQRDLAGYARSVGNCVTAAECSAWLKKIHDRVRRDEYVTNPARAFMASMQGKYSTGKNLKLRAVADPFAPAKPVSPAPVPAPAPPPPVAVAGSAPAEPELTDEEKTHMATVKSLAHEFRVKMKGSEERAARYEAQLEERERQKLAVRNL